MKAVSVVLGGGVGKRMGSSIPKQFLKIGGRTLLEHSFLRLVQQSQRVAVVLHPDWTHLLPKRIGKDPRTILVDGGETRQLSVYSGLSALVAENADIVIVHDGVRPLFSDTLLKGCIESALQYGSGIASIPVSSTLAIETDGLIREYVDRQHLRALQTPQAFGFPLLWDCHNRAKAEGRTDFTDDSQVIRAYGHPAHLVSGEDTNIKITTPGDLKMAAFILKNKGKIL